MSDLPIHHDGLEERRLGLTLPPAGMPCAAPMFPDNLTLDANTIYNIAKSGKRNMRGVFGPEMIQDQGSHGSCNGFSEAEVLRKAILRKGLDCPALSGAYAYSLMNNGSDNGSNLNVAMEKVAANGICLESTVGKNAIYRQQYNTSQADAEANQRRGFECYALTTIDAVFSSLALGFDVVVAVEVGGSFSRLDGNGFAGVSDGGGNHAMSADGLSFVGGEVAADGVNHWTRSFGQDGRCYFGKRHFEQTIQQHCFYAVRSAQTAPGIPVIL